MKVKKRSGALEEFDNSNIRKQTEPACKGLTNVSFEKLELMANISFSEGMLTTDIQDIYIQSALNLIDVDAPDWTFVASRLLAYDMYHNTKRVYEVSNVKGQVYNAISLTDYLAKNKNKLSYITDGFDLVKLQDTIRPERDELFTYLALETLMKRYQIQINGEITELPQHMFMSLAMFMASVEKTEDRTEWAIKFYNTMSLLEYLPATPTLSNGRTVNGNCMSCAVGSTPDNLTGIFEAYAEQAVGSKHGTGFGWDWTRIRALGGIIGDVKNAAGGLVPWLKLENDIAIACDQLGVRSGAIMVSIETWHKDIFDFLDMKKNSGDDNRRAKELFLGVSASNLFMNRVQNNEEFTLFDPYDVKVLTECYGTEFEEQYVRFESLINTNPEFFTNPPVVINAKDLYKKIQTCYWETGMPFLFFKDTVNEAHECPELGIVRSTNLCTEIFQSADENKTILCNLGSVNLAIIHSDEDLERVIPLAHRMLDNIVDLNYYCIPKSEENQKHTRAVGLGICGEAELIANNQIMYGSVKHREFIDVLYSKFALESNLASTALGDERGTWSKDSKYRNAYRRAIAPTSSISILLGTTAMHEPAFAKQWIEENKIGAFKVTAPNINANNYSYYVSPYDVDQEDMIRCHAIRKKYFDQGVSHNMYFRPGTSGKKVYDTIFLAWKLKLKSTYYLRSESVKLKEETREETIACFGCSG